MPAITARALAVGAGPNRHARRIPGGACLTRHELELVGRAWGAAAAPGGAIMYRHLVDVAAVFWKLLPMGAKECQPITPRGDQGFVTAAVTGPFGTVLGIMDNPHYVEKLRAGGPA